MKLSEPELLSSYDDNKCLLTSLGSLLVQERLIWIQESIYMYMHTHIHTHTYILTHPYTYIQKHFHTHTPYTHTQMTVRDFSTVLPQTY